MQAAAAKAEAKADEQVYQQDWNYQQEQTTVAPDTTTAEWGASGTAPAQEWGAETTAAPVAPAPAGFGIVPAASDEWGAPEPASKEWGASAEPASTEWGAATNDNWS
eukprot:Seg5587.3 transcript_id=Seg5587.3/GoldUCD/mRNA.D3Y31 product="hypothetical protein" protein_id=Seg5587.3/GoldUCD/D3Y31